MSGAAENMSPELGRRTLRSARSLSSGRVARSLPSARFHANGFAAAAGQFRVLTSSWSGGQNSLRAAGEQLGCQMGTPTTTLEQQAAYTASSVPSWPVGGTKSIIFVPLAESSRPSLAPAPSFPLVGPDHRRGQLDVICPRVCVSTLNPPSGRAAPIVRCVITPSESSPPSRRAAKFHVRTRRGLNALLVNSRRLVRLRASAAN